MKRTPAVLRLRAQQDIDEALDFYEREGGATAATAFIDALQQAIEEIRLHPAMGSPRYGQELDLPGLRHWRLKRFPYLVFYREDSAQIDIWRVLHDQRDIPVWMSSEE
ncbi:MAG: type II toxin-antitoxin system RelE/ParE family toxin [Telluria sp.]